MANDTLVDTYVKTVKNHPVWSKIVFLGIVFLALISFAEGLSKAGKIFGASFANAQSVSAYDHETKEALIAVAEKADSFFLKLERSPSHIAFSSMEESYIEILVDIRSILLRNRIRPLNDISIQQTELILDSWKRVEDLANADGGNQIDPNSANLLKDVMFQAFQAILVVEELKRESANK